MRISDEELDRQQKMSDLHELVSELHVLSTRLYKEIIAGDYPNIVFKELKLSEIFTLYVSIRTFLASEPTFHHREFYALMDFWKETYSEMKSAIEDSDQNTSWLYSRFTNYDEQNQIVLNMLNSHTK